MSEKGPASEAPVPPPGGERPWRPKVLAALRQRVAQRHRLDQLISSLPALHMVANQVRLAGQSPLPVLIVGEAGAGKKWLARAIHFHGAAAEQPFAVLDCARLPLGALAAVILGERAAIGAPDAARSGPRFGTLYLDDPGSLPRDLQCRLCDRLASAEGAVAAPRLIAGSAFDLEDEVRRGRLLEELRCALSTMVLRLPPLRERRADLPGLVERMLERAGADHEPVITGLSPEAWDIVQAYVWPGNLRELYAALLSACTRAAGTRIEAADLPVPIRRAVRLGQMPGPEPARSLPLPLDRLLEEAERRLILLALERTRGHKAHAADLLGIQRPRLFRRMKALGLMGGDEPVEEGEVEIDDQGE